jgi:hypothetical protein
VPNKFEFRDNIFILTYGSDDENFIPYFDVFDKSGEPILRINMGEILSKYNISLRSITAVKVPMLDWSARNNFKNLMALGSHNGQESIRMQNVDSDDEDFSSRESLRKLVVVGECLLEAPQKSRSSVQTETA